MEVVEHVVKVSAKLGSIWNFCEFSAEIHQIKKCTDDECRIGKYNNLLRKTVFNPELAYDFRRNFFVTKSVEHHRVFESMSWLQNTGKENVKKFVEKSNHSTPSLQVNSDGNLLVILIEKKEIKRQIDLLIVKIKAEPEEG